MKPRRWLFLAVLVPLLLAAATTRVSADAAEKENPAEAPIGTVFRWLNFFLVFGGAGYLMAKRAPEVFRRRADAVAASIREAAAAKAEGESQLQQAEAKLHRLDQEVAELRAAAQRESAAEAERIRAFTREEAAKIERAAQAEMEAAERAARIELKAIAGCLALERADALIRQRISAATQASLFRAFVDNLAGSAN